MIEFDYENLNQQLTPEQENINLINSVINEVNDLFANSPASELIESLDDDLIFKTILMDNEIEKETLKEEPEGQRMVKEFLAVHGNEVKKIKNKKLTADEIDELYGRLNKFYSRCEIKRKMIYMVSQLLKELD